MESGIANIFRLSFTTEKVHSKQTNILSIKRHQDYEISYQETMPVFFARFLSRVTDSILQNLNFLRRRCREKNNKLDMTLNGNVLALT